MNTDSRPVRTLDCRGTHCPEPVLRTRRAVDAMRAGEILEVLATDPLAELDLAIFCQRGGHEMILAETLDGQVRVQIRVNPAPRPAAG